MSPHAYHVVSNGPVVVYQFNPIIQQYSNDASTLIPVQALGTDYIAVGFQTANPCAIAGLPGADGVPITARYGSSARTTTRRSPSSTPLISGDSGIAISMTPKDYCHR